MVNFDTPIAVIDDDAQMRRMIRSMLRKIGFQQVSEDDGRDALSLLRSRPFGLVLSDLMMQPMNGLQLLKRIRADQDLASLRFIMVTGAADVRLVTTALELGVDAYLIKPFNTRSFERRVVGVLELVTDGSPTETTERDKPAGVSAGLEELRNKIATLLRFLRTQVESGNQAPSPEIVALARGYLASAVALGIDEALRGEFEARLAEFDNDGMTRTPNLNGVLLTQIERRQHAMAAAERRPMAQIGEPDRRSGFERRCHIRFKEPALRVGVNGRIYRTENWSIGGFCIRGFAEKLEPAQQINATFAIEGIEDIDALHSAPALVMRCDPLTGILAGKFKSHVSPTLKLLEYMTRKQITPVEAGGESAANP